MLEIKFTLLLGEIQQAGASETAGKSVTPCFTLVSDYKRLDTRSYCISLAFTSTRSLNLRKMSAMT